MADLLEQIKQLTHTQQLALIREITLNLEEAERDELSAQQKADLDQSSLAAHENPNEGSDWLTVRARLVTSTAAEQSE